MKIVHKLFYDSHYSKKRAFTFEYLLAQAGKRSLLTLPPHRMVLSKKTSLSYKGGGDGSFQLVLCCNHRRGRQTEDLTPLSSSIHSYTVAKFLETW